MLNGSRLLSILFFFLITTGLFAQENFTTNSVRVVSMYRTNPGQFDAYMKYLRANFLPQQEEAKKQGLILDYTILLNTPSSPDDWDIAVVVVHKNFGDALDYNQSDADKRKEIMSKHYKTTEVCFQFSSYFQLFWIATIRPSEYNNEIKLF